MLRVQVPSSDKNKSRWPVAYYWQRLIGTMEKISLWLKPGEPYNIRKSEVWLKKQYGALISTLSEIQDPMELVESCRQIHPRDELPKKYQQIIAEHKRNLPEKPPSIRYLNHGWFVNGEFYPFHQTEISEFQ